LTLPLSEISITRENSKLSVELDKGFTRKSFDKNIHNYIFSENIIEVNISVFDVFMNKIITYIYVLGSRVGHRIMS